MTFFSKFTLNSLNFKGTRGRTDLYFPETQNPRPEYDRGHGMKSRKFSNKHVQKFIINIPEINFEKSEIIETHKPKPLEHHLLAIFNV